MSAPPVPEIETLFAPWAGACGVVLAVSGGPDSLALLLLAAQWAKMPGRPPLYAATVDHGLRPEAASEARLAAEAAGRLHIPHATLYWTGEKPVTGMQEAARDARYGLLMQHARETGADVLMTAHHADDQAETVLFRLSRGSGIAGLAGMQAHSERNGLAIARPLLALRKLQLVHVCRDAGQPFAEDPGNADPRYARTRMRQLLAGLESQGLGVPVWTKFAERAARAERALDRAARCAAEKSLSFPRDGEAMLDVAALAGEPDEIQLRVLSAGLKHVDPHTPHRLERLEAGLQRLQRARQSADRLTATLAGCKLRFDGKSLLHIVIEPARRRGRTN